MIGLIALSAGILVVLLVFADFVLGTTGNAIRPPLSGRLAGGVFALLRALTGAPGRGLAHRLCGPVVMTAVALFWILGLWTGWTLVFVSDPGGVAWMADGRAAGIGAVLGHAGHQISTLGGGETEAQGAGWLVAGALAAIIGMVVMTLSVSFILSTTETVTDGQALCALLDAFDPADPEAATTILPQLAQSVSSLNASSFALYYSHDDPERRVPDRFASLAWRVAHEPEAMRRYRPILARLPGLAAPADAGAEAFAGAVERWSRRFALSPRRLGEARARGEAPGAWGRR